MMLNAFPRRRVLLLALAGVVLVSRSRVAFGLSKHEESQDKVGPVKAEAGKANGESGKDNGQEKGEKGTGKKSKSAVLTVVVTGKGKPIPQAEVKVRLPRGEEKRPTNQAGEASFSSPVGGTAEVRVIVAGWESVLQEVVLKDGPQRLTIELRSLPDSK